MRVKYRRKNNNTKITYQEKLMQPVDPNQPLLPLTIRVGYTRLVLYYLPP